jgi:hypothetical protein
MENQTFFDLIDTEAKAYWLGFLYADGYVYKSQKQVSLNASKKDTKHIQKFALIFSKQIRKTKGVYPGVRVILSSMRLTKSLMDKGIVNKKSLINSSRVLDSIPITLLNHFMRGYFDGDGYIGTLKITNESRFVLCGMSLFLERVMKYIRESTSIESGSIYKDGKIYKLQVGGRNNLIRLREWLYKDATVFLERKQNRFFSIQQDGSSRFKGVHWCNTTNKWLAKKTINGKTKTIGKFLTEDGAKNAYLNYKI